MTAKKTPSKIEKLETELEQERASRDEKIRRLYEEGWTLQRIADEFGISKQRVEKIVKRK